MLFRNLKQKHYLKLNCMFQQHPHMSASYFLWLYHLKVVYHACHTLQGIRNMDYITRINSPCVINNINHIRQMRLIYLYFQVISRI